MARERVRLPTGGLSDKYHYYDSESRQTGSSTWGGAAFGTTSDGFDPFGRPTIIYPPDANPGDDDHAIHLSYEGFRNLVTREVFERSEILDATGKRLSVQYPVCLERDGGCGSTQPRTVNTTYHASTGFLTGVTGWASSISYHSNMGMSQIQHSNGILDAFGRDPQAMARPSSLHAKNSSGDVLWETGTFHFDGAGNLIELDADAFRTHPASSASSIITGWITWAPRG